MEPKITEPKEPAAEEVTDFGRFNYSDIFEYLRNGSYPSDFSKSDKASLRKRAKSFWIKGVDLFYKGQSKTG